MNKKLKRKQALIMAEPYRTPFNSKVAKVSGDVIEDSVGGIKYATSFDGATKIVDGNKNLLVLPDTEETTLAGVTYSIKDGVITLNGTTTGTFNFKLENVVKVEVNQTYYLYQKTENTTSTFILVSNIGGYSAEPTFFQYNNKSKKMTKTGYLTLHLYITNTTTFTNAKFYVMLVLGTTAPTEFEPNFKNLLEFDDKEGANDTGITYSIKNGVITFSATPSETIRNMTFHFNAIGINVDDTYSIALFNQFTSPIGFFVQDKGNAEGNIYLGINENIVKTWTVTTGSQYEAIVVYLDKNKTYTNEVIKPILVRGSIIPTQFIPFANPYFVSLGQNGSVQYNGLESREIDLKGNVISKINNQASDKLSNYALTKNTKVVDLGSLTWNITSTSTSGIIRFVATDLKDLIVSVGSTTIQGNLLCTMYATVSGDATYGKVKGIAIGATGTLSIYDPEYNTSDKLEAFKKAIRGTLLMYQVKNPTTINTTSFKTFKEDTNATISDDNFTSSPNVITETFKPTRSYDFKVNGFSNVIKSSNLLNLTDKADTTIKGITYSIKNGIITINGTTDGSYSIIHYQNIQNLLEDGATYSFNDISNNDYFYMQIDLIKIDGTAQFLTKKDSFTWSTSVYSKCDLKIQSNNVATTFDNLKIKPTLVKSSIIPSQYKPYFDPYIESFADKKNLLELHDTKGTIAGVTYSIKNNVVTLNGTPTGITSETWLWFDFVKTLNGSYSFNSFIPEEVSFVNGMRIILYDKKSEINFISLADGEKSATKTISNYECKSIGFSIYPTQVFKNLVFKLMFVEGNKIPTTFLPYQDKYSVFLNVKGKNLFDNANTPLVKLTFNDSNQDLFGYFGYFTKAIYLKKGKYTFKSDKYTIVGKATKWTGEFGSSSVGEAVKAFNATIELEKDMYVLITNNYPFEYEQIFETLILVEGDKIPEYESYYSFTKEVLIKQPLRKFDYLTYDGVYRQTNEIVLDGTNNIYVDDKGKIFLLKIPNADSVGKNWLVNVASEIMVTTSNLPLLPYYNISNDNQMGIGTNQGNIILRLDDSADNSLNNWTVEKVNNYFKQNPITITYKTVDQTFEATSLTRLLFKNGYNKITAYDSINNNAIVEYLEYYKSK